MKFLLVYPPMGSRLSVAPHLKRAIEECGYEVEVFDFSKVIPICLSKIKMKDQDLAFDMVQGLLIKKALEIKPDIFLDIMPVDEKTVSFLKNKGIITCFWFLKDGFSPMYHWWKGPALGFDFFFYIQPGRFVKEVKALGVRNSLYLPHGSDPQVHKRLNLSKSQENRIWDIGYGICESFFL